MKRTAPTALAIALLVAAGCGGNRSATTGGNAGETTAAKASSNVAQGTASSAG